MAQVMGLHNGADQARNNILRPPMLTVPPMAYAGNRPLRPTNAVYAQQTVQTTDDMGNGASHVRIANGGYRTVQRVINISLAQNDLQVVRLVNNVGSGTLGFSRIDGYGSPAGFMKLYDDRDQTSVFILSPGMSISLDPNMHRLAFQGSGCDAASYAVISYAMEMYAANVVFADQPAAGDLISMGDFVIFEVCENGDSANVAANHIAVELPVSGLIEDFCANLIIAFNTTYIAAVEPTGSQTPFHWAKLLTSADLVSYRNNNGSWMDADSVGVQFCSIDAAMIRNITSSIAIPSIQISKQL